ncbi:uncharacterized protein VTP21DRAFT_6105 [Calcarisporiella thermophila]|uniref:uncharacterized protein n=1 Tax=Calcarisporiella thermophila TaxID=911321 RepID=UPI0037446031
MSNTSESNPSDTYSINYEDDLDDSMDQDPPSTSPSVSHPTIPLPAAPNFRGSPSFDPASKARSATSIDEQALRKQIMAIHADPTLNGTEKARKIQDLMCAGWQGKMKEMENGEKHQEGEAREEDKIPTYSDKKNSILGCKHYRRGAKLQADCCGRWFTCRFCHDEATDHAIVRHNTKYMLCMYCRTPQPAAQSCSSCQRQLARYFCTKCKLWDDSEKNIYHCDACGICRIGREQEYFHCGKCNACMPVKMRGNHRCIERNLEQDCPICGEYLFTSTSTVIFMPCGHSIHYKCHEEYIQCGNYHCPTCFKSVGDMEAYFRRLDAVMAQQEMPPEYRDYVSLVFCNDCEQRCEAPYHFLYHKCKGCGSYNVKVLNTYKKGEGNHLANGTNGAGESGGQNNGETCGESGSTSAGAGASANAGASGSTTFNVSDAERFPQRNRLNGVVNTIVSMFERTNLSPADASSQPQQQQQQQLQQQLQQQQQQQPQQQQPLQQRSAENAFSSGGESVNEDEGPL